MGRVTASLTVALDAAPAAASLALEMHHGPAAEYGFIPIRLYPPVEAKVRATRGTAHLGEIRTEEVEEIISFSGSKTATLKRPGVTWAAFYSLQLAFDADGNEVYPALRYDAARGEVVADVAFYGAFRAVYRVDYRLVYYRYEVDSLISGAVVLSLGMVYAFFQGASASIEIGMDSDSSFLTEIYRVYSKIVLDPKGAWEMPPNWPNDGKFPTHPQVEELDPDNSFTDERKHRIGYITKSGVLFSDWFSAPNLNPEIGAGNYHPKYFIKWASAPDGSWTDAFDTVKKGDIQTELASVFPGLVAG